MAYENELEALNAVVRSLGLPAKQLTWFSGEIDGGHVYFTVKELYTTGWRSKPTGRYQITVDPARGSYHRNRPQIFRTKKELNNEFDVAAIVTHIKKTAAEAKANAEDTAKAEATKKSNQAIVETVKAAYTGKRYIMTYGGGTGCIINASESQEGKVYMQWSFSSLTEEQALKLINTINEFEAEIA